MGPAGTPAPHARNVDSPPVGRQVATSETATADITANLAACEMQVARILEAINRAAREDVHAVTGKDPAGPNAAQRENDSLDGRLRAIATRTEGLAGWLETLAARLERFV